MSPHPTTISDGAVDSAREWVGTLVLSGHTVATAYADIDYVAALMLGVRHLFVAWLRPPAEISVAEDQPGAA